MDRPVSNPTPRAPGTPQRAYWLLAAFVVVAAVLRAPLLGRSVWFDEACMSDQRLGTFEQLLATVYVDIHPPLYVVFMHCWNGLFGDGELAMRLPPLLAGLLSIPLMFWSGRWFVGDTAALWGALLLALSPVHLWYSTEARLYAPMLCCTLLLLGTWYRLTFGAWRRQRLWWTLHVANVAVMLALHYYLAVFVVLLGALAPVAARGFSRAARALLVVHGTGLVLLAGFVLGKRALGEFETGQDYMTALTPGRLADFVFDWCWTGHTLTAVDHWLDRGASWLQEALGVLLLGAGLWQLARTRAQRPLGPLVPVLLLAIPALLFAVQWFGIDHAWIERSSLPSLPFVFLLAGAGLAALPARLYLPVSAALLLLGTASLIAFYRHRDDTWTVYKPNADWRAAARWLGAEIDAGHGGRPVFTSTPNPRPLAYYDARIQDVKNLQPPMAPEEIGRKVRNRLGDALGAYAERSFAAFAEHNRALLAGAQLRVWPCRADPAELDLAARGGPGVCYLVRDEWHPPKDGPRADLTVERLWNHPKVHKLGKQSFAGITVYKVRIE